MKNFKLSKSIAFAVFYTLVSFSPTNGLAEEKLQNADMCSYLVQPNARGPYQSEFAEVPGWWTTLFTWRWEERRKTIDSNSSLTTQRADLDKARTNTKTLLLARQQNLQEKIKNPHFRKIIQDFLSDGLAAADQARLTQELNEMQRLIEKKLSEWT
ncbi:MAG: hypothetical protein K2X47_02345, partial [Bdellovibrionales bacterium]|nr:hypothetical protein [Bdellovibrionales bacterium]